MELTASISQVNNSTPDTCVTLDVPFVVTPDFIIEGDSPDNTLSVGDGNARSIGYDSVNNTVWTGPELGGTNTDQINIIDVNTNSVIFTITGSAGEFEEVKKFVYDAGSHKMYALFNTKIIPFYITDSITISQLADIPLTNVLTTNGLLDSVNNQLIVIGKNAGNSPVIAFTNTISLVTTYTTFSTVQVQPVELALDYTYNKVWVGMSSTPFNPGNGLYSFSLTTKLQVDHNAGGDQFSPIRITIVNNTIYTIDNASGSPDILMYDPSNASFIDIISTSSLSTKNSYPNITYDQSRGVLYEVFNDTSGFDIIVIPVDTNIPVLHNILVPTNGQAQGAGVLYKNNLLLIPEDFIGTDRYVIDVSTFTFMVKIAGSQILSSVNSTHSNFFVTNDNYFYYAPWNSSFVGSYVERISVAGLGSLTYSTHDSDGNLLDTQTIYIDESTTPDFSDFTYTYTLTSLGNYTVTIVLADSNGDQLTEVLCISACGELTIEIDSCANYSITNSSEATDYIVRVTDLEGTQIVDDIDLEAGTTISFAVPSDGIYFAKVYDSTGETFIQAFLIIEYCNVLACISSRIKSVLCSCQSHGSARCKDYCAARYDLNRILVLKDLLFNYLNKEYSLNIIYTALDNAKIVELSDINDVIETLNELCAECNNDLDGNEGNVKKLSPDSDCGCGCH